MKMTGEIECSTCNYDVGIGQENKKMSHRLKYVVDLYYIVDS